MILRWQFFIRAVSLAAVLLNPAYAPGQNPGPPEPAASAEGRLTRDESIPVRLRDVVLFDVHEPIGAFGTRARANAIEQRVMRVASGPTDVLNRVRVEEHSNAADLYAGDVLICTVTDADAQPVGRTHEQLAADYATRLRTALSLEFQERSLSSLIRSSLITLAATVILLALLIGVRRLYVRMRSKLAESAFKSRMWTWLKRHRLYVHYEINAYTKSPSQMVDIYSRLNANIQDACNEAGVEIMSPHFAAVREGNRVAIPDDYLPKNYRAPSFNFFSSGNRQS